MLTVVSSAAEAQLLEFYTSGPSALASVNTFTSGEAIRALSGIDGARRHSFETLAREPAIARVLTRNDDSEYVTYYICRDTPEAVWAKDDDWPDEIPRREGWRHLMSVKSSRSIFPVAHWLA